MASVQIIQGDCLAVLKTMPDCSVDSIVTDPPYGLSFMGKRWDYDVPGVDVWRECLRVLKPGGHLLSFGGSRTYHRLACAIEDAGFEIRDQIMWLYGSGYPKSHNLNGDWQGWGTALKPAHEPIVMARKPLIGTVAANVMEHGTGAINVDGCRVEWPGGVVPEIGTPGWGGPNKKSTAVPGQDGATVERVGPSQLGRWPANVIHDGSDEVVAGFPVTTSGSRQAGVRKSLGSARTFISTGAGDGGPAIVGSTGSAARFFYCAKANKRDRGEGNTHPTVKPTDLMAYLCRLVTPPGGLVLDPFMGSGSTGKAALREGFRFIGIEREAEYVRIARGRVGTIAHDLFGSCFSPIKEPQP